MMDMHMRVVNVTVKELIREYFPRYSSFRVYRDEDGVIQVDVGMLEHVYIAEVLAGDISFEDIARLALDKLLRGGWPTRLQVNRVLPRNLYTAADLSRLALSC
jgi:hypothetical protein